MSTLHKFLFQGMAVRGQIVNLNDAWQEIVSRRANNSVSGAYPLPIIQLLGEVTAASVLLQSSIRFDGTLIAQIAGDGPVKLLVAEVDKNLKLRSTATLNDAIPVNPQSSDLVNQGGNGRCAITLDPRSDDSHRQPYQGIVPLVDANGKKLTSIASMIELYMQQSEQLQTTLVLAANKHTAAGLMLQKMPAGHADVDNMDTRQQSAEDFSRLSILARSLSAKELLEDDTEALLHRLFWNEPLALLASDKDLPEPEFHCSCSRERIANMLESMGEDEARAIIKEQGRIEVGCEFCGRQEYFDSIDVSRIFASHLSIPPSTRIH